MNWWNIWANHCLLCMMHVLVFQTVRAITVEGVKLVSPDVTIICIVSRFRVRLFIDEFSLYLQYHSCLK